MAQLVEESDKLTLATPVVSNVCNFYVAAQEGQDELNANIVNSLQLSGEVVFSTTKIEDRTVIRAAIVNHRTTFQDIERSVKAVISELKQ